MHIYLRGIGTGIISHIIGYAVLMLPWIIMLIVFRLCKKNIDNNSALNVLCFIPAIITLATSILSGFELRGLEAGLGVISHTVVQIIFCAILLTANILCGIWIFKNTYKEKIPNNQHGQYNQTQPYYPQQYNPRLQYGQSQFVQHQYNQPQNVQPQNNEPVYQPQEESKTNMNTESEVEKIKAYKELLDSGAITQEEYDFKKKQLLGMQKASKGSNMNGYNKGRGLAVTSGILFIIYAAVSNLYFFRNIEAYFDYKTTDAVINVALRIVPLFILGIMMFIGKMHVGLLIPPLLISSQYISYIIMDIDEGYSDPDLYFFYVLSMIPWVIMFIILIVFINNRKILFI